MLAILLTLSLILVLSYIGHEVAEALFGELAATIASPAGALVALAIDEIAARTRK